MLAFVGNARLFCGMFERLGTHAKHFEITMATETAARDGYGKAKQGNKTNEKQGIFHASTFLICPSLFSAASRVLNKPETATISHLESVFQMVFQIWNLPFVLTINILIPPPFPS
jgi:hypothetical protein